MPTAGQRRWRRCLEADHVSGFSVPESSVAPWPGNLHGSDSLVHCPPDDGKVARQLLGAVLIYGVAALFYLSEA
jgi:hypothetical protein